MRLLRSTTTFFFFNDTATTEIYTLSLHDALPISRGEWHHEGDDFAGIALRVREGGECAKKCGNETTVEGHEIIDRKSTRLNSSHQIISYAVFCLKKKKKNPIRFIAVHAERSRTLR